MKRTIAILLRLVAPPARLVALLFAAGAAGGAWAGFEMTNPVTGEKETYTWKFTGTDAWNSTDVWENSNGTHPSGVPAKTDSNQWEPLLIDGNYTISTFDSWTIEGWNLRMGFYNGANVSLGKLKKLQGDTTMWITVDEKSHFAVADYADGNFSNNQTVKFFVANANGIIWRDTFARGNNTDNNTLEYYLKGAGSVSFQALNAGTHKIKMADVTLTGTSQVSSKTLVSFTSTTKTFTADAAIKVYDTDGTTLKKLVGVTAVRQPGATIANTSSALTTADAVGTCEIVQCTDGIVLYYVDGAPSAVTGYKPSININFTHSGGNLTTSADVGLAPYAVPGTVWNNYAVPDNGATSTQTSVYSINAAGVKSLVSGATVSISGTRGSHTCSSLTAASDLRHGYIDEKATAGQNTPTVVVSGISYERYRVVIYAATDTANVTFNYITINGTDYTYVNSKLATRATAWGSSGAANSANALAEGVNVLVSPVLRGSSTATISGHKGSSARGCIAAVQIVEYTPEIGENDLVIELDGDKTHTFEEAKTYNTVYVTGSGTLTFAGTASTATTLDISGSAAVNMNGSLLTPTAVTGTGTAIYDGEVPPADKDWTDSANWTGTVWIKDFGSLSTSGRADASLTADMPNWGNSGSKVKFTNIQAYSHGQNLTCSYTLVLEDGTGANEYAWRCDNGYQDNTLTVARLSGSGTFYDHSGPAATFTFNSFDGFTGKFDITSNGHQINVPAGATLTVAQNSSIKFTDRGMLGTLNIAQGKTFTAASSDAVSYDTGSSTVNVYGTLNFGTYRWTIGPNTVVNLYEGAIVRGSGDSDNANAAMDFNVANGSTIHAIGNATVSCTIRNNKANGTAKINVDSGKTLTFSGNHVGSYGLKKQGDGILKLTGSIEKFPTIDAGTVLLGGNKEWNLGTLRDLTGYTLEAGSSIAITQTKEEYGSGVTTVTGVDSSIASITVNKPDGKTATITPASGTGTLSETAVVSGSAVCNHDYEFDNAWTDAGSDQKDAKTWDSAEPNFLQDGETSNWSVYTAVCPGNENTFNLSGDWSAAIRCMVPQKANGVIVAFGNNSSFVALAAGATENTARLVKGGGDGAVTELATMSVVHATTAMHVYAFVKTANAVDIYCDGARVTRYNGAIGNLSDGFQFGTVRSVSGNVLPAAWGIVRLNNSEKDTGGNVDYMRIYNFAIDANMIAKLSADHPYVSPSTAFTRTLAGESGLEWFAADAWTKGGETAAAPDADGKVELTASADSTIAANLSEAALYETLTFKGAGAITLTKATGGATLSAVEVAVDTDTTVAADAVDFTVSRVAVAAGKTLTFDVSGIASANGNWANAASVERIRLTGLATLGASATVAVTPTTAGYWNLSVVEDGGYYYLSVMPVRSNCEIYWQSGYWSGGNDNAAVFTTDRAGQNATKYFAGDTVIVPNATQRWMGPVADGATLVYDCNGTINVSRTESLGYVLKNATVTVASGTTLNFVNQGSSAPEVYGGTISGAGKVQVASGITLTLSNGATINSATALAGAGTVNLASVPTAQMTFNNWKGTVVLPAITSNVNLTLYGNSDSTIGITSLNTYLTSPYTEIDSTLRLDGAINITAFSNRDYSFTKITGNGNLTFPNSNSPTSIAITELANYTGTLINNHESVGVAVTRVTKSVDIDGGALLLATNGVGEVSVSSFEVAGVAVSHYAAAGGFYRGAARYDGTVYKTFAEAIAAADLAGDTYEDVTILDPTATCPDGYYVDTENGNALAKYAAAAETVVGVTTTTQWFKTFQEAIDAAVADNQTTYAVAYADGTATAASLAAPAFMLKSNGYNVSVTCSVAGYGAYAQGQEIHGFDGVYQYSASPAAATFTWTGAEDNGLWETGGNWSSTDGTVNAGPANSLYTVVLNTAATIALSGNVNIGTVNVGAAVTVQNSGAQHAVLKASSIVLTAAGASIAASGVSGHKMTFAVIPTSGVPGYIVQSSTSNGTTTYSLTEQITVDDAEVGYMDNATAVITNTAAAVTVPASAQAVELAFSTGSEITLTSTTLALSTQNITVYATDADGQKTSIDISSAFKVTAGENNTYTISLDGSAIVGGVKVQPTIGESAMVTVGAEEKPAAALSGTGEPSFAIKTIPGLWYAVKESTDASTFTAGTPVQATSAGTLLSAEAPSSGVKYYKIAVGASKAALQ